MLLGMGSARGLQGRRRGSGRALPPSPHSQARGWGSPRYQAETRSPLGTVSVSHGYDSGCILANEPGSKLEPSPVPTPGAQGRGTHAWSCRRLRQTLGVLGTTDAWCLVFPGQPLIPQTFPPRPAFPSDWHWAFLPISFPSRYKTLGVRSGTMLYSSWHGPERLARCWGSLVTHTCALLADEAVCLLRAAPIIPAASEVGGGAVQHHRTAGLGGRSCSGEPQQLPPPCATAPKRHYQQKAGRGGTRGVKAS